MQCGASGAFAASSIKGVVAHRSMPGSGMPRPSGQVGIDRIDYSALASGQLN